MTYCSELARKMIEHCAEDQLVGRVTGAGCGSGRLSAGSAATPRPRGDTESALSTTNGLSMINGLSMTNGLSGNGLSGNGLSGNGLLHEPAQDRRALDRHDDEQQPRVEAR